MKKSVTTIAIILLLCLTIVACKKSETKSINVDMDKCISALKDGISLEPDYTFVNDYVVKFTDDQITISIVVYDSTDPSDALDFADTVVRQMNLYAQMQDSSIESASADYYGGLYDSYNALVGIAPLSKVNDQDDWYAFCALTSGKSKLKLNK